MKRYLLLLLLALTFCPHSLYSPDSHGETVGDGKKRAGQDRREPQHITR